MNMALVLLAGTKMAGMSGDAYGNSSGDELQHDACSGCTKLAGLLNCQGNMCTYGDAITIA
jgi:hypothetical protein